MGNPLDQMTRYMEFVKILAPHKVGYFRISVFIPNGICLNKLQSTLKIKLFPVV